MTICEMTLRLRFFHTGNNAATLPRVCRALAISVCTPLLDFQQPHARRLNSRIAARAFAFVFVWVRNCERERKRLAKMSTQVACVLPGTGPKHTSRRMSLLSTVPDLPVTLTSSSHGADSAVVVPTVDAALAVVQAQSPRSSSAALAAGGEESPHSKQRRRASLDVKLEYSIAMVNEDASLDCDDRFMCPFGTRRDSVCGQGKGSGASHAEPRLRRNLKKTDIGVTNNDERAVCSSTTDAEAVY
jgi:hypothetical protein